MVGAGVPDPTFGAAANQSGVWNNLSAPSHNRTFALRDLDGALTSGQLHWTESGSGGGSGWVGNDGGYRLLLNDYKRITIPTVFTFYNLVPGRYILYTYGIDAVDRVLPLQVYVQGAETEFQTSGNGLMPGNTFIESVTHCIHSVNLSTTVLRIEMTSLGSAASSVNGFQLKRLSAPEPGACTAFATGLILTFAFFQRPSRCKQHRRS